LDAEQVIHCWLTAAADDLGAAEHLFECGDYLHALYFGHMYLEKMLKARAVHHTGEPAPHGYNLCDLAEYGDLDLTLEWQGFLVRMTEYSLKTRYPDLTLQFRRACTRQLCERELNQINDFGAWISAKITSQT
jgi:HEPN domain-containing protein